MTPLAGSRLEQVARERRAHSRLVGVADRLVLRPRRRIRRLRRRIRREYKYWRKHELGWVLAVLVLSRSDTPRSRVLRAMLRPDVERLRSRWSAPR